MKINLKGTLSHNLQLTFDKTLKVIDYDYKNKGKYKLIFNLKYNSSIKMFLREKIENLI